MAAVSVSVSGHRSWLIRHAVKIAHFVADVLPVALRVGAVETDRAQVGAERTRAPKLAVPHHAAMRHGQPPFFMFFIATGASGNSSRSLRFSSNQAASKFLFLRCMMPRQ